MARKHGISTNTYDNFIIDSGAVYKNYGISSWTITLATVIATDAVVVNGQTYTAVAADPGTYEFAVGISDTATATNLAAKIDAISGITSTADGAVVTVLGDTKAQNIVITTPDSTMTLVHNGLNSTLLGATRGGSTFNPGTEWRTMEVDGARGGVVGDLRIVKSEPKLTVNLIEINSAANLGLMLPGATIADYPSTPSKTHDKFTRSILTLGSSSYLANVAIVGECTRSSTGYIEIIINNAICKESIDIAFADKDESVLPLVFTGNFTTADLDTEPFEVYYPIVG